MITISPGEPSVDPIQKKAIFVETHPGVDISRAPFCYQDQYRHARRLFLTSFETLYELADIAGKSTEKIVVLYSLGRCGSTWLSKIFAQAAGVLSLSEPDVFSQIVLLRDPCADNQRELLKLLSSCLRLVCKPSLQENVSAYVLKPRSFCIEICDLIHQVFPQVINIFLYRDLEPVVCSSIQAFSFMRNLLPSIKDRIDIFSRIIPLLKHYEQDIDYVDPYAIDLFVVAWLSVMYRYKQLCDKSVSFYALRYEDLVIDPRYHIHALFDHCGLHIAEAEVPWEILTQDAQAGTGLSRRIDKEQLIALPELSLVKSRIDYLLSLSPSR